MSNIIARMAEPLPTVFRGAGQWLALSRKYKPLGDAIKEHFGESVNAHSFGHWLKARGGETVDGVTLTSRYNKHKKQWLYHAGEPPAAPVYVTPVYEPMPCPPLPKPYAPPSKAEIAAAMVPTPKPKPVEAPRHVARFVVPGIVDDANGESRFTAEYASGITLNPFEPREAPRQAPYVPELPASTIRQHVPDARRPGVTYGPTGTRTGGGGGWSPFNQ